jgi:hypothetical protein
MTNRMKLLGRFSHQQLMSAARLSKHVCDCGTRLCGVILSRTGIENNV